MEKKLLDDLDVAKITGMSYLSEPITHPDMPAYFESTELEHNIKRIGFSDVINDFKKRPIYTFRESKIYLVSTGGFVPSTHEEIYKYY